MSVQTPEGHARWLTRVADLMLIGTMAALTLPPLAIALLGPTVDVVRGELITHWLVPIPYLYAVLAIRRAFAAYASGRGLPDALARACRHAGAGLAIGAAASAFGVPLLLRWLADPSHPMSRTWMVFDVAYMAIGVAGLAFILLGGLIERAAQAQARADALERELTEFV